MRNEEGNRRAGFFNFYENLFQNTTPCFSATRGYFSFHLIYTPTICKLSTLFLRKMISEPHFYLIILKICPDSGWDILYRGLADRGGTFSATPQHTCSAPTTSLSQPTTPAPGGHTKASPPAPATLIGHWCMSVPMPVQHRCTTCGYYK